jgi:hypothetical protein
MHNKIHINLSKAHDTMMKTHSKINETKTVKFHPGAKVLFSIKIERPNGPDKLQARYTGPSLIKKNVLTSAINLISQQIKKKKPSPTQAS